MSAGQVQLLIVRGVIAGLSSEEQAKVGAIAQQLRQIVSDEGEIGTVAFALVAAEKLAED